MNDPILLEICVDSVDSAVAVQQGGAHRVELCSNLLEGGVTPSAGLIASVRAKISIDLHVMIRPRGGDFCYSTDEFETMQQDINTAKQVGVDGIAFGVLTEEGGIDRPRSQQLVESARPLKATFHRAFDMSRDLSQSLEDVIAARVDRVLTSGGKQRAEDSVSTLLKLNQSAADRIIVMMGGGISEGNVHRLIAATGVREIHASVRVPLPSPMRYRNESISFGPIKGHEYERVVVAQEKVRRLLESAVDGWHSVGAAR